VRTAVRTSLSVSLDPAHWHRPLAACQRPNMSAMSELLTSPLALPLALSLLLLYTFARAIINWRSLAQFPGPPLAKTGRSWLFWQSLRARLNVAQVEALQQYGKYETLLGKALPVYFQTLMLWRRISVSHRSESASYRRR
jgi:hypothetical protein